jgi:hypothetical protein
VTDLDYPAAHSMDSCWFAVDRDGHVAYFSTGEAGAMPEAGVTGDDAFELRDRLARSVPPCEVIHDPRGHLLPDGRGGIGSTLPDSFDWPILVFVTSLAPFQSDIEAGQVVPVRAAEGYAVVLRRLTAAQSRRYRDAGVVRAWTYHHDSPEEQQAQSARFGVYEYGHLCENWIAGPYGREAIPSRPLHVDQLPPAIRKQLKEATLADRTFAETSHIQPFEHWECQSWEEQWMGLDGTNRSVGGDAD